MPERLVFSLLTFWVGASWYSCWEAATESHSKIALLAVLIYAIMRGAVSLFGVRSVLKVLGYTVIIICVTSGAAIEVAALIYAIGAFNKYLTGE